MGAAFANPQWRMINRGGLSVEALPSCGGGIEGAPSSSSYASRRVCFFSVQFHKRKGNQDLEALGLTKKDIFDWDAFVSEYSCT